MSQKLELCMGPKKNAKLFASQFWSFHSKSNNTNEVYFFDMKQSVACAKKYNFICLLE